MNDKIISFIRKKDLRFIRELGQGACGRTVILHDDLIDESFVCKKFSPIDGPDKKWLFENFIREIKILHLLHHTNIVRIFNYYLYPEQLSGFLLMELVNGYDIEEYLSMHPEQINEIFKQTIDGFAHLESNGILHRDIRPLNIMVSHEGVVKIIDFGFGKQIYLPADFDKSITLNWWCERPNDFNNKTYDFSTEVYFVGKLFEKIISENSAEEFKNKATLNKMCQIEHSNRTPSFVSIRQELLVDQFDEVPFSDSEMHSYRTFSSQISLALSKIENNSKYHKETETIERRLDDCYRAVMLEEYVPTNKKVLNCFINGAYYFSKKNLISVNCLKNFLALLRSCSKDKKEIILANIMTRLDAAERYTEVPPSTSEDIPF